MGTRRQCTDIDIYVGILCINSINLVGALISFRNLFSISRSFVLFSSPNFIIYYRSGYAVYIYFLRYFSII